MRSNPERCVLKVRALFASLEVRAASARLNSNLVGNDAKRRFPKAINGWAYVLGCATNVVLPPTTTEGS